MWLSSGCNVRASGYERACSRRREKCRVTFTDGRTHIADVKGVDQTADIALLKLNLRPSHVLPRCDIGDSDEVDVGDWAVAVGNPFGLDNSGRFRNHIKLSANVHRIGYSERRSVEFFKPIARLIQAIAVVR